MSKCYTYTRVSTKYSTKTYEVTTFRNSLITLRPTGTQTRGSLSTSRVPVIAASPSYITLRSTYTTKSCTTSTISIGDTSFDSPGIPIPTSLIVVAVLTGVWLLALLGATIFVLCFSRTAKRERARKRGAGLGQNQLQNTQPQEYTAVPQEPLYSQSESHYSHSPYGGIQRSLESTPQTSYQTSYVGYQNYNANANARVMQGPNQWPAPLPGTPSAASANSMPGPGPGYIPPGAAAPAFGNSAGGTITYSTTPLGAGSDPYRMLYTQPNDRLSAAVSLVHPPPEVSQQQYPEQRPFSGHSTSNTSFGQQQQPYSTSSQTQLAAQYRGYAEPVVSSNYNGGGRF